MIDAESAVSVAIGLGSIGIGMLGLASAHIFRTMKTPKETSAELSSAMTAGFTDLRKELNEERAHRVGLALSNERLATEVKHLGENVGRLAVEVKGLRDSQWTPQKQRRS